MAEAVGILGRLMGRGPARKLRTTCAALVCLVSLGVRAAASDAAPSHLPVPVRAQADAYLAGQTHPGGPGVAVAVRRAGRLWYSGGQGLADLEHGVPMTPTTPMHVASLSKQVTAFAIHVLVSEGRLSLEDDIRTYLPQLHDFGKTIRVRHLLHHTSGLRDQSELLSMAGWRADDVTTDDDVMRILLRQRALNHDPGKAFLYTNTGYTLLAQIVRRVTGMTLAQFAQQRMFTPLGMEHTHFQEQYGTLVKGKAQSYETMADGVGQRRLALSSSTVGPTNLVSTAEDMAIWSQNLLTGTVGGQAVARQMRQLGELDSGRPLHYGSGLARGEYRGLPLLGHDGSDAGYRSVLEVFEALQFSVVVLANGAGIDVHAIARGLTDIFLSDALGPAAAPELLPAPAQQAPAPAAQLESVVGDYVIGQEMVVHFTAREGRLYAQPGTQEAHALEWLGQSRFFDRVANVTIEFAPAAPGTKAASALLGQGGRSERLERVEQRASASQSLKVLEGEYYSDELHVLYSLSVKGGRLVLEHPRGEVVLDQLEPNLFLGSPPVGRLQFECGEYVGCTGFTSDTDRVRKLRFTRVIVGAAPAGDARRTAGLLPAAVAPVAPPFARSTLFLRGSANQWQAKDPMVRQGATRFELILELAPGRHEFKIATEDFSTIDLGSAFRDPGMTDGRSKTLEAGGENIVLDVPRSGVYRFVLDVQDPFVPKLTVEALGQQAGQANASEGATAQ